MAKILPENTTLPEILEGDDFLIHFTTSLESDEILVSMKIDSNLPSYIDVETDGIIGKFKNEFSLNPNSLKYRNGLDYGVSSSFDDIPIDSDIYSFETPSELKKYFNIVVSIEYTLLGSTLNSSKEYILPLQGNWDSFKNKLLEYIK